MPSNYSKAVIVAALTSLSLLWMTGMTGRTAAGQADSKRQNPLAQKQSAGKKHNKRNQRPSLLPVTSVILLPMVTGYHGSGLLPVVTSNAQIASDFASWILKRKESHEAATGEYLRRMYAEASEFLQDLNAQPPEPLAGFAYLSGGEWVPLAMAEKNGASVLLITSLKGKYEYNLARDREAAIVSRVVQSLVFPVLKRAAQHFGETEIEYFGAVVSYGVRDFLQSENKTHIRTLCVVSPAASCGGFLRLEITDRQLAQASDAYLLADGELRKAEIDL